MSLVRGAPMMLLCGSGWFVELIQESTNHCGSSLRSSIKIFQNSKNAIRTTFLVKFCLNGIEIRSEKECAQGVDSTTAKQWKNEKKCGRPLGLRFEKQTGNLYIADAYYGLLMVGPQGGIATPLATHVDGTPILFANDLDIHNNGSIFFTDTSKRYNRV